MRIYDVLEAFINNDGICRASWTDPDDHVFLLDGNIMMYCDGVTGEYSTFTLNKDNWAADDWRVFPNQNSYARKMEIDEDLFYPGITTFNGVSFQDAMKSYEEEDEDEYYGIARCTWGNPSPKYIAWGGSHYSRSLVYHHEDKSIRTGRSFIPNIQDLRATDWLVMKRRYSLGERAYNEYRVVSNIKGEMREWKYLFAREKEGWERIGQAVEDEIKKRKHT